MAFARSAPNPVPSALISLRLRRKAVQRSSETLGRRRDRLSGARGYGVRRPLLASATFGMARCKAAPVARAGATRAGAAGEWIGCHLVLIYCCTSRAISSVHQLHCMFGRMMRRNTPKSFLACGSPVFGHS
jgi:hypothetical protein